MFVQPLLSVLWGILQIWNSGSYCIPVCNFLRTTTLFPQQLHTLPSNSTGGLQIPRILANTCHYLFFVTLWVRLAILVWFAFIS
jgi:hypothetical protein